MFITIFFHHRTQVIIKFVFVKYIVPINNRFRITFQIMVIVILWKSDKLLSKVLNFMRSDFLLVRIRSIKEWVAYLKQVVSFIIFSKQKSIRKVYHIIFRCQNEIANCSEIFILIIKLCQCQFCEEANGIKMVRCTLMCLISLDEKRCMYLLWELFQNSSPYDLLIRH